jgi:hypothetical protein
MITDHAVTSFLQQRITASGLNIVVGDLMPAPMASFSALLLIERTALLEVCRESP